MDMSESFAAIFDRILLAWAVAVGLWAAVALFTFLYGVLRDGR
jgi:hypothetical protein